MRRFLMTGIVLGCLLFGSLYPRMILEHHVILVDETGKEFSRDMRDFDGIPVEFQFRFLQLFR